MTPFETTLYGGLGFFAIMGIVMTVVNWKMIRGLKKGDNETQNQTGVNQD